MAVWLWYIHSAMPCHPIQYKINLRMRRSLAKLLRLVEYVSKVVTGCLRTTKGAIFVL